MITKTLVFSDVHIPFHNPIYIDMILEIVKTIEPDRIIINGDLGDFYSISRYDKSPEVVTTYDNELEQIKDFLQRLKASSSNTVIVYLLGNHEKRIEDFIIKTLGPMANRLSYELELDLDNLVDEWHEYKYKYRVEKTNLTVTHSPPSYSVNAARASIMARTGQSYCYACTHRPDFAYQRRVTNDVVEIDTVYINGFLGDKELTRQHYKVFDYEKLNRSCPSMMMITVIDEIDFSVELALIKNNIITIDGKTFRGE